MIDWVVKKHLCTGCGLCASLFKKKVSLDYSSDGFIRPIQLSALNKDEENLFKRTCPGIYVQQEPASNYDVIWGPIKDISSGFSVDESLRYKGSSGGALSAFLYFLIKEKIVDYVLHTGASTINVTHCDTTISLSKEDILDKAGSRYAPSSPLKEIIKHLDQEQKFAIVGKPCDIVGVRNLIRENPKYENKIKVLISFMCAGVPSITGTEEVISELNVESSQIKSLRYRGEGWPGYFKIVDFEKKEYKMTYNESWGKILNKHLQFRCKICPDGTGEFADIVFADSWEESSNGFPSFEERPGLSLIISRTSLGENMIKDAISKNFIKTNSKRFSSSDLEKIQPYQFERKGAILPRLAAMVLVGKPIPNYNWRILYNSTKRLSVIRIFRNFLGMLKRLL